MKKSLSYLSLIALVLIMGGFGCNRQTEEDTTMVEETEQHAVTTPDLLPPPPEVIADIRQEGYSEKQQQYLEVINEAPNQDIDIFQAELGL